MHQRLKSSECQWCLEDHELHLLLTKDCKDTWWKTLFCTITNSDSCGNGSGGTNTFNTTKQEEERSYYELLQEAVDADEPVVPYDEMNDEAKELLERLLERQAMVHQGSIDLQNGFDDFRVVIGEKSLGNGNGNGGDK